MNRPYILVPRRGRRRTFLHYQNALSKANPGDHIFLRPLRDRHEVFEQSIVKTSGPYPARWFGPRRGGR